MLIKKALTILGFALGQYWVSRERNQSRIL